MGGVDSLGHYVALYRTRMRQKKWRWLIFIYFFDVTVVNSWILWKKEAKSGHVPLLDYRRKLVIGALKHQKQHGTIPMPGRRAPVPQTFVR